jgi:hypothetical protein
MIRTVVSLSFAAVLAFTPFAAAARAQQSSEALSKKQLQTLIVTAKTSAEHLRIAQYYETKAEGYLAESRKHEEMTAQYAASPVGSSSKFATGTVSHCVYLTRHFKAEAAKMQLLEQQHEQMAKEAAGK